MSDEKKTLSFSEKRAALINLANYVNSQQGANTEKVIKVNTKIGRLLVLEDNKIKIPKAKVIVDQNISKQTDLEKLSEKDYQLLKISSFLDGRGVTEGIVRKLNQKELEKIATMVGEYFAADENLVWKIGNKQEVTAAYLNIRSCMTERTNVLDFYLNNNHVFFFLVAVKKGKPLFRCLFIQNDKGECIPVRKYSSVNNDILGFTKDNHKTLTGILKSLGKTLQPMRKVDSYENLFAHDSYVSLKTTKPQLAIWKQNRFFGNDNLPYFDFPNGLFSMITRKNSYKFCHPNLFADMVINNDTRLVLFEEMLSSMGLLKKYKIPKFTKENMVDYVILWNSLGLNTIIESAFGLSKEKMSEICTYFAENFDETFKKISGYSINE